MLKSSDINTCNTLDLKKNVKEDNKILLKDLTSTDDINTREYIRSEQGRILWKKHKKKTTTIFGYKICLDNILEILEVSDQVYLTISAVVIFQFL